MSILSWEVIANSPRFAENPQHHRLVCMINEFSDMKNTSESNNLSLMFSVIIDYFSNHFKEEVLSLSDQNLALSDIDLFEFKDYKQAHNNLISSAGAITSKLENGDVAAHRMAVIYLKHLIKMHASSAHGTNGPQQYAEAI